MHRESVVMVEFWFGLQGFGTGLFTISCFIICQYFDCSLMGLHVNDSVLELSNETLFICFISTVSCLPQIYAAISRNTGLRHWSNFLTALLTALMSISLALGSKDGIAIAGYGFLSLATFYCFYRTGQQLKNI